MDAEHIYSHLESVFAVPRFRELYGRASKLYRRIAPTGHGWDHVKRVVVNAAFLCMEEKADHDIVLPAAILHDIGYALVPGEPWAHHVHGANGCFDFLAEWKGAEREAISSCILKHKGRYPGFSGYEPATLEEKVVCDSDQLDKVGWIGLLQVLRVYVGLGAAGFDKYRTIAGLAEGLAEASSISLYTRSAQCFASELGGPSLPATVASLRAELSRFEGWGEPVKEV